MTQQEMTDIVNCLFDSWHPRLVRYAYRLTNNRALAQDVVQDSFMQLYQALGAGKKIHNPRAWTLCVVRREVGKHMKRYGSREVGFDGFDMGSMFVGRHGDRPDLSLEQDDIAKILSRLSPREHDVMLLRMESLKCREIASELGISINSVTTLLARALRKLEQARNCPVTLELSERGGKQPC
jgi:RNA polymerase sigma-70 factor (ECF subfamily)